MPTPKPTQHNDKDVSGLRQTLHDLLAEGGCPICRYGHTAGQSYLDSLLYESVNDLSVRRGYGQTSGYCDRHNSALLTFMGKRVNVAKLQETAVRVLRQQIAAARKNGSGRRRGAERMRFFLRDKMSRSAADLVDETHHLHRPECPICAHETEAEARCLRFLLRELESEFMTPLREAGGLCWPHTAWALAWPLEDEVRTAVLAVQEAALAQLEADLTEFIRKNDYRFTAETVSDKEATAVERALQTLAGIYPPTERSQTRG